MVKEKNKKMGTEEDTEEKRKVTGGENMKSNTASCIVSVPTHFLRRERDRSNPLIVDYELAATEIPLRSNLSRRV